MPPVTMDRRGHVETFAGTLSDLRQAAGCPSFRQMAVTSGCISHATLHEATRGKRLPTWETTEQFLLALGADPVQWRSEWERADRLVNRTPRTEVREMSVPEPPEAPVLAPLCEREETAGDEEVPVTARRRPVVPVVVAVALVLLVTAAVVLAGRWGSAPRTAALPPATAAASSSAISCAGPGERIDHTWSSPVLSGGGMQYVDGALRECSVVRPESRLVKAFSLKNTGTTPWRGWRLHRVALSGPCTTQADSALPALAPGRSWTLSSAFRTTAGTGLCRAEWEIRTADGRQVFPGSSRIPLTVMVATG